MDLWEDFRKVNDWNWLRIMPNGIELLVYTRESVT
jgi:hypothetical protein